MFRLIASLSIAIVTLSTSGCLSSPATQPVSPAQPSVTNAQTTSPQQFGQNPEGFVANPGDPNRGFVVIGGSTIPVVRGASGWEAADSGRQPRSIMNSTPDRYDPMVSFLQRNNLSLKDWNTLGEAYAATEVQDQKAETRVTFLRGLDDMIQNNQPKTLQDAVGEARNLRTVLNQIR